MSSRRRRRTHCRHIAPSAAPLLFGPRARRPTRPATGAASVAAKSGTWPGCRRPAAIVAGGFADRLSANIWIWRRGGGTKPIAIAPQCSSAVS